MPGRFGIYALAVATAVLLLGAAWLVAGPDPDDGPAGGLGTPGTERLDSVLEAGLDRTATPGAQAVVMFDGEVLWAGAAGESRIAGRAGRSRPVDSETLFSYASFGKQVLAAYVLSLAEQGRIDLDRPIGTYLGDGFPGGRQVTTRMLLNHTAGYPDLYSAGEVARLFGRDYDPDRRWSFDRLLPGIEQPADPGGRWQYSNTGYIVLLHLVERLTPGSLSEEVASFLSPAGVSSGGGDAVITIDRSDSAAERFAHGYFGAADSSRFTDSFDGATAVPTDIYGSPFGDGAFAGNALGAAAFLDSLFAGGELLEDSSVEMMVDPVPDSPDYGLGSLVISEAGAEWQGHDGSYGGFTTAGFTDRARGVTIFVAANKDDDRFHTASVIWKALARELRPPDGTGK